MNKHIVYKTVNKVNGKVYIGVHKTDKDKYMGSGKVLKLAIKKYGLINFRRIILFSGLARDEAYKIEKLLVTPAFLASDKTYNLVEGGRGGCHGVDWDKTKGGNPGKRITTILSKDPTLETTRINASRTPEAVAKRVKSFKSTLRELRKDSEYNEAFIKRCNKTITPGASNYDNLSEDEKEDRNSKISEALQGNTNSDGQWAKDNQSIEIHQYSKENIYIQTFSSLGEAARQVSGNGPNISKTIDNPKRHSYGFKWKSTK